MSEVTKNKWRMINVMSEMGTTLTTDLRDNQYAVTGIFLDEHGVEADFVLENISLLQTLNENKAILAKVVALCSN